MNPATNDSSDIYCLKKIRFEINGSVYLFLIRGGGKNTIPIMSGIVVKFPRYISPRADLIAFSGGKAFCLRTTRAILSSTTKWNENNARPIRLLPKEAQHMRFTDDRWNTKRRVGNAQVSNKPCRRMHAIKRVAIRVS